MADKRKLQGDIDRCLKKVAEGVEQFEDIWQKVHSASNANQKEKYEADLKKEIKKLQRLRDQIKTWLTSNDIKDKTPLMENRKLIETQMERFKAVERETKTKAYSKEGLGLAAKIDPAQKEKEELRSWLADRISKLNIQIDQFESEMESLFAGTKKKKVDKDKTDRAHELQEWVDKHKFHIQKAETMMRMMDNCSLDTSQVKEIQDDLNYYVDSNQDADFMENEMMYDDMDLEEAQSAVFSTTVPGTSVPNQINEIITSSEDLPTALPNSSSCSSVTSKENPLSPKTPTAMRSTSQELFEERRRGKTSVSSSAETPAESPLVVPPSPGKPSKPSQTPSSSVTSLASRTGGISLSKMTPNSGKPNSLGSSSRSRTNSSSAIVTTASSVVSSSSNGSKSGGRSAKPNQLPHGHGYAVVAGGSHQQMNSHSSQTPTSINQQHLPHVPPTTLLPSSSSSSLASTPTPSSSTSSLSSVGHQHYAAPAPLSSNISISGSSNSTIVGSTIPNCVDDSTFLKDFSSAVSHERVITSQSVNPGLQHQSATQHLSPTNIPPISSHVVSHVPHPVSLVYTTSSSQRPIGPGSFPSQHSEHSRTSSSSSSFSPSTLSQDSQSTAPLVLSQPSLTYSQPSNPCSSLEARGSSSVVGGPISLPSLQSIATMSTSGPPSVDTTHFSPASQQDSASHSPNTPQLTTTAMSFSQSNPTPPFPPVLPGIFQQPQLQQQLDSAVTQVGMTWQPNAMTPYHNRTDNCEPPVSSTAVGGGIILPGQTSISPPSSGLHTDYDSGLPPWLPHSVSMDVHSLSINVSEEHITSAVDSLVTSHSSDSDAHSCGNNVLGDGNSLGIDFHISTSGLVSSSSLLSSMMVSQQQAIVHSHFTPSLAPLHIPQSAISSGLSTNSSGTSITHHFSAIEPNRTCDTPSSLKAMAAQVVAGTSSENLSVQTPQTPSGNSSSDGFKAESHENSSLKFNLPGSVVSSVGNEISSASVSRNDSQLHPLLGVTPLGPIPLTQDKIHQLKMLDVAFRHLPQPSDSEKVRSCIQRFLCPTPFYHHQNPPSHLDSFEFFQRLSIETLFFIFYYLEGSKAQYLAAKALKKLSWRFHTKYMMWFQRLEEPKAITDDYEMGTYIYFDFEKWSQRRKEGFTFEYRYLEDKDLL